MLSAANDLQDVLTEMGSAATHDERSGWDERLDTGRTLRTRLVQAMRKELKTT